MKKKWLYLDIIFPAIVGLTIVISVASWLLSKACQRGIPMNADLCWISNQVMYILNKTGLF